MMGLKQAIKHFPQTSVIYVVCIMTFPTQFAFVFCKVAVQYFCGKAFPEPLYLHLLENYL